MRIGLRIDSVAQLLCHIGTQVGHSALDFPQEASDLVFLRGPSMVLVALALAVVLRLLLVLAWILALVCTISIWRLILDDELKKKLSLTGRRWSLTP